MNIVANEKLSQVVLIVHCMYIYYYTLVSEETLVAGDTLTYIKIIDR